MNFYIEIALRLDGVLAGEELEEVFDGLADSLADMDGMDADASMDLEAHTVQMCLTLAADSEEDAFGRAMAAARTAIHAAGGGTAGWEAMTTTINTQLATSCV